MEAGYFLKESDLKNLARTLYDSIKEDIKKERQSDILNTQEACELLKCSEDQLRSWHKLNIPRFNTRPATYSRRAITHWFTQNFTK